MSESDEALYRKLQVYLDSLPIGYPKTKSGADIRILKRLFTPNEVEIALRLKLFPLSSNDLYPFFKKSGMIPEQLHENLLRMAKKGAINWTKSRDDDLFSIAFFMIGMVDYQIDKFNQEFVDDINHFLDEGFVQDMLNTKKLQLRVIPIEESINTVLNVSNFDEIKQIIERIKAPIYVSPCVCRQMADVDNKPCKHPKETCFTIGEGSRVYLNQARLISKEETIAILKQVQAQGMVLMPSNTVKTFVICCCCGCSCKVLTNLKKYPNPIQFISSNYYIEAKPDLCNGCGKCISICPMNAIKMDNNHYTTVDLGSCIGCGVCVPKCINHARHLVKKATETTPPNNLISLYQEIAKKRLNYPLFVLRTIKDYASIQLHRIFS